jgi:outer membrane protein
MYKPTFLFVLVLLISGFQTLAQSAKFGHINSAELLSMMPATKSADSTLQKYGQSLEAQLKVMTNEYQSKLQEFQSKEGTLPDAVRQIKIKEINDLESRIEDFRESAQQSIQKKKEELYTPVLQGAEKAIKEIAKEKSYAYIFDTSAGTVLFAQDSDNIMTLVKQKLGLK